MVFASCLSGSGVRALKIREFFTAAIQAGIDADPRGRVTVEQELREARKAYEELKAEDKATFDQEKLENPYTDSRILHGSPDREVTRILAGIDIETPELLLADRLIQKGTGIDLVLAHHPEGRAYANFYEVMKMQADILNRFGVPINVAESQLSSRMKEVERGLMPMNHARPVDAARLLDIPYLCLHTPADNMVSNFLQALFEKESPSRLKDAVKLLKEIPEYQEAARNNAGPRILVGSDDQRPGRVFVDMTGGTLVQGHPRETVPVGRRDDRGDAHVRRPPERGGETPHPRGDSRAHIERYARFEPAP